MKNKIKLPEGWVIDPENSTDTEIAIKQKEEKKFLTWEEIQEENKKSKNLSFTISNTADGNISRGAATKYVKCQLPTGHITEKVLALCQMYVIADYYNRVYANGWVADWKKRDEKFHVNWDNVDNKALIVQTFSWSDSCAYFASEKLALMAYNNNKEIFEKALKP